jgi:hypothetical protein
MSVESSLMSTQMYDISPADFAHHVRHANSWNELGIRCGLEPDELRNRTKLVMIQQKVNNMRLNVDHFRGQQPEISDDVFKTIVRESDCVNQIMKKCTKSNSVNEKEKILKRIEDLDIDISHFKKNKIQTPYKYCGKLDAIDDETFKMLVNNNRTWKNLVMSCGYTGGGICIDTKKKWS